MKRCLIVLLGALLFIGCKGKQGVDGPTGPQGNPGVGLPTYSKFFKNGVWPSTSYAGNDFNRVDAANPYVNYQNDGSLKTSNSVTDISKILARFKIDGAMPINASITGAILELEILNTSNIGAVVSVGAYNMSIPAMVDTGSCIWVANYCNWVYYGGGYYWITCGGGLGDISAGNNYDATPMDVVTLPSSISGTYTRIGWNIPASIVQKWLNSPAKNNGVVLCALNEGTQTTGNVDFAAPNNANLDYRPNLIVTYNVP